MRVRTQQQIPTKMKVLILLSVLACGVLSEAPAPYAPSGWRPNGPSFELPQRTPVDPRNRNPQKQEYLPPVVDARTPNQEYGPPEVDVSVQGLPTQEQLPIFQLSPVNGQQYVGPTFNADLRTLEQNLRNSQAQQNYYRELARQRQLEAAYANANRQTQPAPRQFVPSSTTTPRPDDFRTTTMESTTEALKLNQGEGQNDKEKKDKVSVEVTKQNVQEYPPELFLTPLAQLQLQNQFGQVQLGQLRAPIYLEPVQNQKQVSGYNGPAQLTALNAYLAQQQLLQAQLAQSQAQVQQQAVQSSQIPQTQYLQPQPQFAQPAQTQQVAAPSPAYLVPQDQAFIAPQAVQPAQYQPTNQYQPMSQYQPEYQYGTAAAQNYPQQPIFLQPQENQLLPRPKDQQTLEQDAQQIQPQFAYQYQPAYQQPQVQQQYQLQYPLDSYQQDLLQPQLFVQDPQLSRQQAQQTQQPQNSLQSGFDVNQQGNGIDQAEEKDDDQEDGQTVTAVATAFGTRTQPRVYATYGTPAAVPRIQANPDVYPTQRTTTEAPTEDGTTVADATAVSRGRKQARLRNRQGRVRPVFTLDKSGHLVLAQDQ